MNYTNISVIVLQKIAKMKIFSVLVGLLFTYSTLSHELKIDNHVLKFGDCLQLKEGKKSRYVKNNQENLKVLEIIDSELDQIIIQSMKTNYYDYLDQNDVKLVKCPE